MLRNSIYATILYYDSFNFPLTLAEVYKYLVSPMRLLMSDLNKGRSDIKIGAVEIAIELDNMARVGLIGHKNGFYFMPEKDYLYERRMEKDKLANKKWKKFLAIAKYLQVAPYFRTVFASGCLPA